MRGYASATDSWATIPAAIDRVLRARARAARPSTTPPGGAAGKGAGLKGPSYTVTWREAPAQATGVDDYLARRVVVTVRRR